MGQEATAYRAQAAPPMAAAEAEKMQQSWEGRKRRLAQVPLHMVPLLQGTWVSMKLV